MPTISDAAKIASKLCRFVDYEWRVGTIGLTKKVDGFPPRTIVLYRVVKLNKYKINIPEEIDIVQVPEIPNEIYKLLIENINKKLLHESRRVPYSVIIK